MKAIVGISDPWELGEALGGNLMAEILERDEHGQWILLRLLTPVETQYGVSTDVKVVPRHVGQTLIELDPKGEPVNGYFMVASSETEFFNGFVELVP